MIDYRANSLYIETQGVSIGADKWGIVATYCYIRRFFGGAWFHRVEQCVLTGRFFLVWTNGPHNPDFHRTVISRLWSKNVGSQPSPLDDADVWIERLEREDAEQRARNAKGPKSGDRERKRRKQHEDELLMTASDNSLSFHRPPDPEKEKYAEFLEGLF